MERRLPLSGGGGGLPALGLGTFNATAPGEVAAAVKAAVRAGYRLIDCAAGYGNESEVGQALAELMAAGEVTRQELFVVSKLFQTHHVWDDDASRCRDTLRRTLADLRLDYLDLCGARRGARSGCSRPPPRPQTWCTGHSPSSSPSWRTPRARPGRCGCLMGHPTRVCPVPACRQVGR